jgi:hypothetical protein
MGPYCADLVRYDVFRGHSACLATYLGTAAYFTDLPHFSVFYPVIRERYDWFGYFFSLDNGAGTSF